METRRVRKLARPPIIEAVVDIDCDLSPSLKIHSLEKSAKELFRDKYPKFRTRHAWKHEFEMKAAAPPKTAIHQSIDGFHFLQNDEKQLVQVRSRGFSFNRLEPYGSLDDYLPEIERTWELFLSLAQPVQVIAVRLRYINRINLELVDGRVELDEYLKLGPRLPDEERLSFRGFLNQYVAVDEETGHQVRTILTTQKLDNNMLPIIFDITAESGVVAEPNDWTLIRTTILSLRELKNRVFYNTLEEKCLQLFQ